MNDGQFKRKCYGLNALAKRFPRNKSEFRVHVNKMVSQINLRLSEGVLSFNDYTFQKIQDTFVFIEKRKSTPVVAAYSYESKAKII